MSGLIQDLRFALRQLRKNTGFTFFAVFILALGIGMNTAIFSIVDAVLLRSLPYKNPARLVYFYVGDAKQLGFDADISVADFLDWKKQNHVFQQIALFQGAWFTLTGGFEPQRIHGDLITANWLSTFGVDVSMGRSFRPEEEQPGRNDVVIITNDCWKERFHSDPNIVGRHLILNGKPFSVVGVLSPGFELEDREIFAPLAWSHYTSDRRILEMTHAVARLKPHVTLRQAQSEMEIIAQQLKNEYPETNRDRDVMLRTLAADAANLPPTPRRKHITLWIMLGAVGLVMLIACANVASLMLARGLTRQKEFVTRIALGCGRMRMIRQLSIESAVLFSCGGALGFALATWSRNLLMQIAGSYLEGKPVELHARVFLFCLVTSLFTGLLFGLPSAFQAVRTNLNDGLKNSATVSGGSRHKKRARNSLVILEISLSMVLLLTFCLLGGSFLNVMKVQPGFDPSNVLTTCASLYPGTYGSPSQQRAFTRKLLGVVQQLPAVASVGITDYLPLNGAEGTRFSIEGDNTVPQGEELAARRVAVTPMFLRTMRIPLLHGRSFRDDDSETGLPVVLINETLAKRYFPGQNPLGKSVRMSDSPHVGREIVGVIADVHQRNMDEDFAPIIYRPWDQSPGPDFSLVVRTAATVDTQRVATSLHSTLRNLDKNQVWEPVKTMRQMIDESESVSLRRPIVKLVAIFGMSALVLALVGIYGVLSYLVRDRTREIGVRMALGAPPGTILKIVLRKTMALVAAGLSVGFVIALALTQFLPTGPIGWTGAAIHLYGVRRIDSLTYVSVSVLMTIVAVIASYTPARRAARVDPMVALRYE